MPEIYTRFLQFKKNLADVFASERTVTKGMSLLARNYLDDNFKVSVDSVGQYVAPFVNQKNGIVNVRDFGAVGNGVVDDTAACQLALNTGKNVFFPNGEYRIVGKLSILGGQNVTSHGATIIADPQANYLGVFDCDGNDIQISGFRFRGNGVATACASEGVQSSLGAAIRGLQVKNITVKDCSFDDFVLTVVGDTVIGFATCSGITISGNRFFTNCTTGVDIALGYRNGECIITDNHSTSSTDLFCSISTVGSDSKDPPGTQLATTSHIVISNNIYINSNGNVSPAGRHGILVHYAGGESHSTITGNILVNGQRHGIYLRGANIVGSDTTGPDIVSNNIIRYFGGLAVVGVEYGYNSGIKVENTRPAIITGNLIERCGYNTDNTERLTQTAGIEIVRAIRNAIISNNQITNILGYGMNFSPTVPLAAGDYSIDKLLIQGNIVKDVTRAGIVVSSNSSGVTPVPVRAVAIHGNIVDVSVDEYYGICVNTGATGGNSPETTIRNNTITASGTATDRWGIGYNPNTASPAYQITGNTLRGLEHGIAAARVDLSGKFSIAYSNHRELGTRVRIAENTFVDCAQPVYFAGGFRGVIGCVDPSNVFYGTSPKPLPNMGTFSSLITGKLIGYDGSGNPLLEMFTNGIPMSAQQYYAGDRIINSMTNSGSNAGWICTASGTPGTWKAFGSIEANPILTNSVAWNPPNIVKLGGSATRTLTVTGAKLGDEARAFFMKDLQGIVVTAEVTAIDSVTATFTNNTGIDIDLDQELLIYEVRPLSVLRGSATYPPPSLNNGSTTTTTVTVTGAALGDFARASFSVNPQGITITATVTAANTVTVTFTNNTGGTIALAEGTLRAEVTRA